ncbi:MAG TPA: hypothetical protein VF698_06330 [Thermoanaerobaculia bacterium]|jgi:hypothetical protein
MKRHLLLAGLGYHFDAGSLTLQRESHDGAPAFGQLPSCVDEARLLVDVPNERAAAPATPKPKRRSRK